MLPINRGEKIKPMLATISIDANASPEKENFSIETITTGTDIPCFKGSTDAATKLRNTGVWPAPSPIQATATYKNASEKLT